MDWDQVTTTTTTTKSITLSRLHGLDSIIISYHILRTCLDSTVTVDSSLKCGKPKATLCSLYVNSQWRQRKHSLKHAISIKEKLFNLAFLVSLSLTIRLSSIWSTPLIDASIDVLRTCPSHIKSKFYHLFSVRATPIFYLTVVFLIQSCLVWPTISTTQSIFPACVLSLRIVN